MADVPEPLLGIGWDRMRGWRDQYDRMQRWHVRVMREISLESNNAGSEEWPYDLWDVAMAFFQSAYHLKDWIIKDHLELRHKLESAFSNRPRLALCADICNGTKHRRVTKNQRVPAHLTGLREYAPDIPSGSRWLVLGPDGPINLDILANDVVSSWDMLLHELPGMSHEAAQW